MIERLKVTAKGVNYLKETLKNDSQFVAAQIFQKLKRMLYRFSDGSPTSDIMQKEYKNQAENIYNLVKGDESVLITLDNLVNKNKMLNEVLELCSFHKDIIVVIEKKKFETDLKITDKKFKSIKLEFAYLN